MKTSPVSGCTGMPSSRRDNATGGSLTIIFGQSGDWVLLNDQTGDVIQVNDRHNPQQEPPY